MKFKLSERKIIERCGVAASNRGERYFKKNNVVIQNETNASCEATVTGIEDFHVEINSINHELHTACTCPKLSSITTDCQHIAAVLYAILYKQNRHASKDFLQLFNSKKPRSFAAGSYFETRKELKMHFICHAARKEKENLFALELLVENKTINRITDFLRALEEGNSYSQHNQLIFNHDSHCFNQEIAAILQYLVQIQQDKSLMRVSPSIDKDTMILLPPSSWSNLFSLLQNKDFASLKIKNKKYNKIKERKSVLPLQFTVDKAGEKAQLRIQGMDQLLLFPAYQLALHDGGFYHLTEEALNQLLDLQRLLQEYNAIAISEEQLVFFSEKVVPKLIGIGKVEIAKEIQQYFNHPPLKAKLFLDRVNNRLLAGLEFHYDYFVIYPLEEKQHHVKGLTTRDMETEKLILEFMDEANFHKTDGGYFLHNEALEYEFLYHILPSMEKHVQVYATTAVRNRILPQPVKPKIKIKHQKERVNWLEFKFEMEGFPEKEIKEILQTLQEKRKYYRMRSGSLLSLESEEFSAIHDFLLQAPIQNDTLDHFEVPIAKGLKLLDTIHTEDVISHEASFQQFLEKITHPETNKAEMPNNLHATLREYQKEGFLWLKTLSKYGFGGILADDMGLGKTVQSITYIASVMQEIRENNQQILIVSPSSVMYHWQNELNRFAPSLKVDVIHGSKGKRAKLLGHIRKLDVVITTYSMIRMDIAWYKKVHFHTIFFDEAQYFKNPRTQTARAVKKLQAANRFALTGTPMENTTEELWSIFHVVFPELFGSLEDYSHLTNEKIARRIHPFMLRRMKKDVAMELPEKQEHLEFVELYPEQKKIYSAYLAKLKHETLKHLDKETIQKNRVRILAGLTRLRQICCHPGLFVDGYKGNAAKFTRLMEIIEESQEAKRRILIFSQFTNMLELIARQLAEMGISFFYLDGTTPPEEREKMAGRFNQGEREIFLISLKAGGTGLNLIGADTVILYDLWWNPAVEEQAADRAYRIGQVNTVQVIKLLAKGTIEEKMYQLQERKRHLIKEIIGEEKQRSTALTLDDIKELLAE